MNKITKSFNKNVVLNSIELHIDDGCTLLLGENGSGKTTLLKVLSGLIKKYDGKICCKNKVSLLLDSQCLFIYKTGFDNLSYFLNETELENSQYL